MSNERKGWMKIITSEDYDKHMAATGEAAANSKIIKKMFKDYPLRGKRLLIPGCGTGQMFDYISPKDLGSSIELALTDINPTFLEKTRERIEKFTGTNYKIIQDDIESTKLNGKYDGILIVLVLHNVSWEKSLKSLAGLNPKQLYIIEMEQDLSLRLIGERKIPETIKKYGEYVKIKLIPREELIRYIHGMGFKLKKLYETKVLDNKTMVGFVFEK